MGGQSLQQQFTAVVSGANNPPQDVTWTLPDKQSNTNTYISETGMLTIAPDETATTLTVRATSTHDNSKYGEATVTITSPPQPTVTSVTVSPATATIQMGGQSLQQQFTAVVSGANNPPQDVTWTLPDKQSNTNTYISETGLLSIAPDETATTLTVRATSTHDNSKYGEATVTFISPPQPTVTSVTVSPETAEVQKGGQQQQFTATVAGENNPPQTVTWTVTGNNNSGTTINANGQLTVTMNETATTLTVRATSTHDNSKYGEATVTIISQSQPTVTSVTVSPETAEITKGRQQLQFTATVAGANNPPQTVTWTVNGNTNSGTTINANGQLTVSMNETAITLTVRATSTYDNSKYGEATVTVISPAEPTLPGDFEFEDL